MANSNIKIVGMTVEDLEQILEVEELCFTVPWSRNSFLYELLENERAVYLVAKDEFGRSIGYVGMWIVFDEGHITNLAIHPLFRRRGAAKALLTALIRIALERGVNRLTLEVRASNASAQNLYHQFGFVQMGVRRQYYLDNNEDALVMWKELYKE